MASKRVARADRFGSTHELMRTVGVRCAHFIYIHTACTNDEGFFGTQTGHMFPHREPPPLLLMLPEFRGDGVVEGLAPESHVAPQRVILDQHLDVLAGSLRERRRPSVNNNGGRPLVGLHIQEHNRR